MERRRFGLAWAAAWFLACGALAVEAPCPATGVVLQVLGSGGPELDDGRSSSGYLIWRDGKARVLVDMGSGSLLHFDQAGARIEDLDLLLLSHLHVDHSADLPALVKAAYFSPRDQDLPLYGPTGNRLMPDTRDYARSLFADPEGAYRYLSDYLQGGEAFRLVAQAVDAEGREPRVVVADDRYRISAAAVHHGPVPALAWRVELGGRVLVFSGDMNGDYHTLERLAPDADLLVAHNAIPEGAGGVARRLHMPPSVIGEVAAAAGVRKLVLSHFMNRTLGRERETERHVRVRYKGPLVFAYDGLCLRL